MSKRAQKKELVGPWRNLHAAVWLIGLAILFWKGWFWPGIIVLIAISMALEGILMAVAPHAFQEEEKPEPLSSAPQPFPAVPAPEPAPAIHRADLLPSNCPKCGAPARGHEVKWTGPQSADCPYCGTNLPMSKG
jgi:hypothetical protein